MSAEKIFFPVTNAAKARKVVKKLRDGCWLVGYQSKQIFGFAPNGVSNEQFLARIKKEYEEA